MPNLTRIPPEIVEEILVLLPNKSIHRFRSVSRSWSSLLVSGRFHELRCKSAPPETKVTKVLHLASSDYYIRDVIRISDYRDDVKPGTKLYTPDLLPLSNPFVGSCNGLVCLLLDYCSREIVVWNPFTGVYRKLPNISGRGWAYTYGFGYVSTSDDYKVLLHSLVPAPGGEPMFDIISLKTGSWKQVENPDDTYQQHKEGSGLFLNGALHWESSTYFDKKIIAFDLTKEKFYGVPKPTPDYNYRYHRLGVAGEYLCMCFLVRRCQESNIVWVMKEYCNEASWVPFISYTSFESDNAFNYVNYASNFVPHSVLDGGYMVLQYSDGYADILTWNNNHEESDSAQEFFNNIKFYRHYERATPYKEALTSPYASTEMDQGF
ncbi:hypothetical protein Tsubulata_033599 [Turnera subulata]|uniref:F-box domain-containing protein n=1 Tax=Turnera subulata TaxID=218843 RepID=A0A9Q0GJB5_9ROSI|nr:hypothetical protein Tsubulata_033599 [Turnera subulata]